MLNLDLLKQRACFARVTYRNLFRLITFLVLVFALLIFLSHYYLSKISGDNASSEGDQSHSKPNHLGEDNEKLEKIDLCLHVSELKQIRASVNNELRLLESKRQHLQAELSGYNTNIQRLKNEHEKLRRDLERLKITIAQVKMEKEEITKQNVPLLLAPKIIRPNASDSLYIPLPRYPSICQMHNCFDYSRCSLISKFPVYIYNPQKFLIGKHMNPDLLLNLQQSSFLKDYLTVDPNIACVSIVFIGELRGVRARSLQLLLLKLPYWRGDGRNHILISFSKRLSDLELINNVNTGRAILVNTFFTSSSFRRDFNIIIPPVIRSWLSTSSWKDMTHMSPIQRKYLLSYAGEHPDSKPLPASHLKTIVDIEPNPDGQQNADTENLSNNINSNINNSNNNGVKNNVNNNSHANSDFNEQSYRVRQLKSLISEQVLNKNLDTIILDTLKGIQSLKTDPFSFVFSCRTSPERIAIAGEWSLCESDLYRREVIMQSTFTLIIAPKNTSFISTPLIHIRLLEALKYGSIPVVLGNYVQLPFSELIDWQKAIIILPKPRITELHFLLRTYTDTIIAEMRRQGRFLWETYFCSFDRVMAMVLATVRTRLQIPAATAKEAASPSFFNMTVVPMKLEMEDIDPETDDVLGPVEPPFPSQTFNHNFSQIRNYEKFNSYGDPFHSFASTPFEPVLPSEAKFFGSGYGFRPINKGAGGAGKEFSEGLGGNVPREQFTVVMLTYERETVLISALQRLKGVPHLNRVVVVWNSPKPPPADLRWPDINVPISVIKTERNTLNNRFLPFDVIETEAILSIDDDVHLRHDEIIFGFRVWREARDRVVGFPGRFHGWQAEEKAWHYNANHSCELSMVLTGAAFFHKYYAYMYSYVMPQAIRDKVDDYINCEDIAMNFLVAHLTRKPPLKVTSRWTFRCPGCSQALAKDETHFDERHKCINFFAKIYGYMPLLYTQFRIDSVLFKTKIPRDKQKCFRLI
ncbi:exostosin-like 3 [Octopus bimaculoides]|uniref:glucuronosyl-galactosyl-proteoglycan 4-alpha-N-acetylglucosaminyltransferase n=1 Tax=Octopus bimaculoides TaxID=37653 RepID=A0A0L8GTK9_OCTBM|nr:exostosin-like 3 [Octopus bimaculoides]|eukprot:XP_014778123.1 PREDICTED: exostosin-like 3 [Octopus bimaculoides]